MGDELSFLLFSRELCSIFWEADYWVLVERASHCDKNIWSGQRLLWLRITALLYTCIAFIPSCLIWPFIALRKKKLALPCCFCDSVYWSLDLMVHLSLEIFFKTFSIFFYLLKRSCSSVWEDFSTSQWTRYQKPGFVTCLWHPIQVAYSLWASVSPSWNLSSNYVRSFEEAARGSAPHPSATYWGLS